MTQDSGKLRPASTERKDSARSASRNLPHETGKQRAARIPLDYYKRPDDLVRRKLRLTLIMFLLSTACLVGGLIFSNHGQQLYSRGPVAAVHATWEENCNACHTPFQPLSHENLTNKFLDAHAGDQKCISCHAGPVHHSSQFMDSVLTCAGCHREHQGRNASLIRMEDTSCTCCHADLASHTVLTVFPAEFPGNVTAFSKAGHPEVRILQEGKPKDPGHLKFNHKLHLTPGMILAEGGAPWTLAKIPDSERERYRQPAQQGNDVPVKLDCASCHQTDSSDMEIGREQLAGLPAGLLPARTTGAHMLPITYEIQCKACHPLTFDAAKPEWYVPHRLQPPQVKEFLRSAYAAQFLSENPKTLDQPLSTGRPLPGRITSDIEKTARTYLDDKVAKAEKIIFGGKTTCAECHAYEPAGAAVPRHIVPPAVPNVWFKHARFDHRAHRAVNCLQCHGQATASTESADVLIPGIDKCLECHGPAHGSGTSAKGGARYDCTECHRYHNGDGAKAPLQGFGARERGSKQPGTIDQFLSGKLKSP